MKELRTPAAILSAAGLLCILLVQVADAQELRVPGGDEPLPPGVIRSIGSVKFRHGLSRSVFSPPAPFFSPNGDTVYVPGNSEVIAFDTGTGEQRFASKRLTEQVKHPDSGIRSQNDLTTFRCVEALEAIGSKKSVALLKSLAAGNPDRHETREARAVLARRVEWKQ